jgi:uncharacterized protein YbjT (DUF2867 family)
VAKLLVLGGSGRTGSHILTQASERGHGVRALVRRPDSVHAPVGVELIRGTPTNIDDIGHAAHSVDAVVVALNNARASDNPWSKQISPPTFMTDAVRATLTVMAEQHIRRIVIISAIGVGDSWTVVNPLMRAFILLSNIRKGYADHNGVDRVVRESDVDWTLVRATGLTDKPPSGPLHHTEVGKGKPGGMTVSRSEVARFVLDAVEQSTWIRCAPSIWNARA